MPKLPRLTPTDDVECGLCGTRLRDPGMTQNLSVRTTMSPTPIEDVACTKSRIQECDRAQPKRTYAKVWVAKIDAGDDGP